MICKACVRKENKWKTSEKQNRTQQRRSEKQTGHSKGIIWLKNLTSRKYISSGELKIISFWTQPAPFWAEIHVRLVSMYEVFSVFFLNKKHHKGRAYLSTDWENSMTPLVIVLVFDMHRTPNIMCTCNFNLKLCSLFRIKKWFYSVGFRIAWNPSSSCILVCLGVWVVSDHNLDAASPICSFILNEIFIFNLSLSSRQLLVDYAMCPDAGPSLFQAPLAFWKSENNNSLHCECF